MRLELRQVEVRPAAGVEQRAAVVEDVEAEVEQARADRRAVERRVLLDEMPAARAHDERRDLVVQRRSCFSPASREIVRRTASRRLTCPSMQFAQVGEFASSKSAMKTLAPELSALINIFRSTGPVISTRRSRRSAGASGTRQSDVADSTRLLEEAGQLAGAEARGALVARGEQLAAPRVERALEARDERRVPPASGSRSHGRARAPRARFLSPLSFPPSSQVSQAV